MIYLTKFTINDIKKSKKWLSSLLGLWQSGNNRQESVPFRLDLTSAHQRSSWSEAGLLLDRSHPRAVQTDLRIVVAMPVPPVPGFVWSEQVLATVSCKFPSHLLTHNFDGGRLCEGWVRSVARGVVETLYFFSGEANLHVGHSTRLLFLLAWWVFQIKYGAFIIEYLNWGSLSDCWLIWKGLMIWYKIYNGRPLANPSSSRIDPLASL